MPFPRLSAYVEVMVNITFNDVPVLNLLLAYSIFVFNLFGNREKSQHIQPARRVQLLCSTFADYHDLDDLESSQWGKKIANMLEILIL